MPSTIEQLKEAGLVQANVLAKSLVLCQITAIDGDVTYLCTTPPLGGTSLIYNGNNYQARLADNAIDQIQAMSSQGFDIPGSMKLEIADGDFEIWNNHCAPHGWRGGALLATFVLYDVPSGQFSTNSYNFNFFLDKPDFDTQKGTISVSSHSRDDMTRVNAPGVARQNRCEWVAAFPTNAAQRYDVLHNPTAPGYGCGYSPDQTGGVGNMTTPNLTNPDGSPLTDSAGIYVMCDGTRSCGSQKNVLTQGCMARQGNYSGTLAPDGDITKDSLGRATARFTGDTLVWPVQWKGKQYTNPGAGTQTGFNTPNPATGTTYYPEGAGTQWVKAQVGAPVRDPNSYRSEATVCMAVNGQASILKVIVNGVELSQNSGDVLFTYYVRSAGGRTGAVNPDSSYYKNQGDPRGSQCYIEIVVPVELLASGIADIQVLVQFPRVIHAYPINIATISGGNTILTLPAGITNNFFDGVTAGLDIYITGNSGVPDGGYTASAVTAGPPGTITIPGTWAGTGGAVFYFPVGVADDGFLDSAGGMAENPVWALMDRLIKGPKVASDFDALTWYNAAQICATQISYLDINGNSQTHARYRCSYVLEDDNRQTLAKAVLAIRNSAGLVLRRNATNGKIQCYVESTLAMEQPSAIAGSNYNTAVSSLLADGTTANGFLAYHFDGGNGTIEKGTFKVSSRALNDSPNIISFPFQDEANVWVKDSITEVDQQGYLASGNQQITEQLDMLGPDNFDQCIRRANVELAKIHFGNTRGDGLGTDIFTFRSGVEAAHLANLPGAICGITYEQLGY